MGKAVSLKLSLHESVTNQSVPVQGHPLNRILLDEFQLFGCFYQYNNVTT